MLYSKKSAHTRQNLEDRRYELLANLLPLLDSDMAPDAELTVRMDFRPSADHSKHVGSSKIRGWDVESYKDPWLELSGRFVDGTSFVIGVVHSLQKRSRTKISASGKYKRKTKEKEKAHIALRLSAKPAKYPRWTQVSAGVQMAVQLPEGATLLNLETNGHRMAMKVGIPSDWDEAKPGESKVRYSGSQTIAMMLMSLYQVLNLAKAVNDREHDAA